MEALADNKAPVSLGWRGLPKVCTVAQLAENFRCSRLTIYRNIYRGDGDDPYKMGAWKERGKFYIDRLEAADWFHRPMREAMASLISAACSDGGGPIKVYVQPQKPKRKLTFTHQQQEARLQKGADATR
jgi:hypothetical protein